MLPNYSITGVPDFDQKRDFLAMPFRQGLPASDPSKCTGDPSKACTIDADCGFDDPCIGTGGGMYCFPTSAMNWMAYLANNGYPEVAPGPAADWESMDVYNFVADQIAVMGDAQHMRTDPGGGTSGDSAVIGLREWLKPQGNKFSVIRIAREGNFCPRLSLLAAAGLSGQLLIVGIGFYDLQISGGGAMALVRDGGHLMSFIGATITAGPTTYEMAYHNPWTKKSESNTEQAAFDDGSVSLTPVMSVFDGYARTQDRLDGWGSRPTFLDAYTAICPAFVATPDPGGLRKINPVPVPPANQPLYEPFPSPTGTAIVAGALLPTFTEAMLITQGSAPDSNRLWHLDLVTGDSTRIPLPAEPRKVVTGRSPLRASYVHCGQQIWCLSRPHFEVMGQAPVPVGASGDAMAYDDENDEVLLLSKATGELLRYPSNLATSPLSYALPAVLALTGDVDLVAGTGRDVWIADRAAATVYRLSEGTGGNLVVAESVSHPQMTDPRAIALNDIGQLIVANADSLVELERDPAGGWQAAANPLFTGHPAGEWLDVVRSRTNFDAGTMTGPAWRNVAPIDVFGEPGATDVPGASVSARFDVRQNRPNPFRSSTTIEFELPVSGEIGCMIFDLAGRRVRTLFRGSLEAGVHTLTWDGRGDDGEALPAGFYFYRASQGDHVRTRRMVWLGP